MRLNCCLLSSALLAMIPTTGVGITVDAMMTPDFVKEHPDEWSVDVVKKDDGQIQFTIARTLKERRYFVVHLKVQQGGKCIASSDIPSFSKKGRNAFYFSLSADAAKESKVELGEWGISRRDDGSPIDLPAVGGTIYHFRLADFIPSKMVVKPQP